MVMPHIIGGSLRELWARIGSGIVRDLSFLVILSYVVAWLRDKAKGHKMFLRIVTVYLVAQLCTTAYWVTILYLNTRVGVVYVAWIMAGFTVMLAVAIAYNDKRISMTLIMSEAQSRKLEKNDEEISKTIPQTTARIHQLIKKSDEALAARDATGGKSNGFKTSIGA